MNNNIDIVLIWVDNNDPEWLKSFSSHRKDEQKANSVRFRDWDNLKFWFRGIEQNAPWVRKVHLVTCGHYPKWLNKEHPKLNLVKHSDYIDQKFLPTFSANPIELNLHKIKGLSEHFIYFNDDMFLLNPIDENFYFKNNLPNDSFILNALSGEGISHIIMNDLLIINKYFNKKNMLKSNINKWFNIKYKSDLLRTLCLLPWPRFTGFFDPHLPQAFLKSTFEEIWQKEESLLNECSSRKFRDSKDVNQYLFRYWQLVSGKFNPINTKSTGITFHLNNQNIDEAISLITNSQYKVICLNDSEQFDNFENVKDRINSAFLSKFPIKSTFEI